VTSTGLPRLVVLCPVFNEVQAVPLFFERTAAVLNRLAARYDPVLVFLNNASNDGTHGAILALRDSYPWVHVLSLSRNVGYQRSLEAGLRTVDGDVYVIIDVDCEDPPEMIETFVSAYEEGYDIAYGERVDREEPRLLKRARHFFYRLMRAIADDEVLLDMAEFSLITREVRDGVIADRTSFPFIRASIGRVGFRRSGIPYKRHPRIAGDTHYNLFRMVTFGAAGLLSASTWLLRMAIYLFPLWLATSIVFAVYAALSYAWALPALILTVGAYIGWTVATVAIYVARVYKDTLGRPNFFIDEKATALDPELRSSTAQSATRL
jgi:polyisoprenyl-phosphate glycosyltransferase